jgi:hypothetical protein
MSLPEFPPAYLVLAQWLETAEGQNSAVFVRTKAELQPDSGAACAEMAGIYAMFDGCQSPLTQSFGLGLAGPPDTARLAELDSVEHFFISRGAPVQHEVSPLVGVEWLSLLVDRGYRPSECSSALYRPLGAVSSLAQNLDKRLHTREARR